MLENALALSSEYAMFPPGGAVLCAVSGGADSVCLLHWLWKRSGEEGFPLTAAHFDHMIRGEESRRDVLFVENLCKKWKIPLVVGRGDVPGEASRRGEGLEETARRLRYAFLERTAEELGGAVIATAHNAGDNAETLLLHLIRGSGLQGLTGIPPRRGPLVRPFLTTSRAEILSYLERNGLPHVEDSTNSDVDYARNRLRHQVLPLLRELNPQLDAHLSSSIARLRADNDCLNAQAAAAARDARPLEGGGIRIPASAVGGQPAPIAVRTVRWLLLQMGESQFRSAHLQAVVNLARSSHPSGSVCLPHGLTVERRYGDMLFSRGRPELSSTFSPVLLCMDGVTELPCIGWRFLCRSGVAPEAPPSESCHFYLDPASLSGPLVVRPRRTGDTLAPPRRSRRTVKKWMIDGKIPRRERELTPLLADEAGPVWLAGVGPDAGRLAQPGAPALEITACPMGQL